MAFDPATYAWLVYVHIFGVFVFLIAHGVSSGVGFRLAKERNRERVAALLEFSGSSSRVMILGIWWILITGLILGYVGEWWQMRWFWAAIFTLIVLGGLMTPLAANPYNRVRAMLGLRAPLRRKPLPAAPSGTEADISAALERISPVPAAAVGMVGIAFLLWLMMFKPF
jgi:DMSO/TMAO reductase YedYZ heme-binding membrane subunit